MRVEIIPANANDGTFSFRVLLTTAPRSRRVAVVWNLPRHTSPFQAKVRVHGSVLAAGTWVTNLTPEEELRLVARLKKRDEAAFNAFVRMYQQRVFALVLRMLANKADAQELTQEVFITVFKSIDSSRGDSRLGTWLYRIAVNHCKNRIKYLDRRNTRAHDAIDDAREEGDVAEGGAVGGRPARPDEAAEGSEMERAVQGALASLEPGSPRVDYLARPRRACVRRDCANHRAAGRHSEEPASSSAGSTA